MVQLPEIAGKDLEHGVRDNRAKNAGAGFRNIAGKGVKGVKGGLEKAQGYGVGGPAVSLAMKGVKMAERRLEEKAGGGGEEGTNPMRTGSGGADIPPPQPAKEPRLRPPPPPLREKASSIFKWLGYKDEESGQTYYENKDDGRVTWSEPEGKVKMLD
jgi:hypothetical protein